MIRQCANCGKPIETDCTEEKCPNYYCSEVCAEMFDVFEAINLLDKVLENKE